MKIEHDNIIFETADFDGLSNHAKKSISVYLEDFAAYFSASINREITKSKAHVNSLRNSAILTGLETADEATKAEAESLLTKLEVLVAPKPAPAPEPESTPEEVVVPEEVVSESDVPLTFFGKVKSLFS